MRNKKGKIRYLTLKIDFEKTYDRVNWKFFKLILNDFGFPQKIIDLIMSSTTETNLSLKWNNKVMEQFHPLRGLRQGDPTRSLVRFVYGEICASYSRKGGCSDLRTSFCITVWT